MRRNTVLPELAVHLGVAADRGGRVGLARAEDRRGVRGLGGNDEPRRFRRGIVDSPQELGPRLLVIREVEGAELEQGDGERWAHRGYSARTTGLERTPTPSTSTSHTSPGWISAVVPGVPVKMRSPRSSVTYRDRWAMHLRTE